MRLRRLPADPRVRQRARQELADELDEFVLRRIAEFKPDIVVMAGRWDIYDGELRSATPSQAIRATIARVKALGVKHVVVMGQFRLGRAGSSTTRPQLYFSSLELGNAKIITG